MMHPFSGHLSERLGTALGWLWSPLFAITSALRHARTFHPSGEVFLASVEATGDDALGARLRGPALVRFSAALWKGDAEIPDVLGCALRLRRTSVPSPEPGVDDQDLLFATIVHPLTMLVAPFTTDVHDFLANDYFAVSPFDVPGFGRARLRLRPMHTAAGLGSTRAERLRAAAARGDAKLALEVCVEGCADWAGVAVITLGEVADVDQERLAFWPFRAGRGVVPRGFVHGFRRGVYTLSQRARPRREGR